MYQSIEGEFIHNNARTKRTRVLFTTSVGKRPDYFYTSVRRKLFRYSLPIPAYGLRFLKENIPEIEIMEYPTWSRFEAELRKGDIDILGISFYMKDGNVALKMLEMARKYGIKTIWGGNYGVLCDEIAEKFDRVFLGYAENNVREALGLEPLVEIKHPVITTTFGVHGTPIKFREGFIFTSRGCKHNCTFCQTHAFVDKMSKISLKSIEDALIRYKQMGIGFISIPDENFLSLGRHSEDVIQLFEKYGFSWGAQTRLSNLTGRVAELRRRGLFMVQVGIESFDPENLDRIGKNTTVEEVLATLNELQDNDIYIHGYYVLGYETDTEQSLRKGIQRLADLRIDSMQITVLTPFPHTPDQDSLREKYGIFETDYAKYDTYHLTWDHPNISVERMHELRDHAWKECFTLDHMFSGFRKAMSNKIPQKMLFGPK